MMFATVIVFLLLTYLLSYLALRPLFNDWELPEWRPRQQRWEERFGRLKGWWNYIFIGAGLLGIFSASVVQAKLGSSPNAWFAELVFGLLAFFFGIMGTTDFFTQKAPYDVQDMALAVIAPVGILGIVFNLFPKNYPALYYDPTGLVTNAAQIDDWYQFVPFFVLIVVLALMWWFIPRSLGFADIAVLATAAFGLGAMIGLLGMFWALIVACGLQLVAFFAAQIWGWGSFAPNPFKLLRRTVNGFWHVVTRSKRDLIRGQSRQLAWLPMICLAYLGVGLILV